MSVVQSESGSLQWLAEDEMKELDEEWVERGASSFDFRTYDQEESGTVKQKATYDSVVVRDGTSNYDDVATTKQNIQKNVHQTPEWKRALNRAENNHNLNQNGGTMAWNSFFKAPTLKGAEMDIGHTEVENSSLYNEGQSGDLNGYSNHNINSQHVPATNDINEVDLPSGLHNRIQDDANANGLGTGHENRHNAGKNIDNDANSDTDNDIGNDADNDARNDIGNDNGNYHGNDSGNDTDNDTGYDTGHDTGHDTGNEIHEDGDESLPSSKSRLKVFQKHDTYTNCRLEDLLGTMVKGSGRSTTHSTTGFQSHSDLATETDNSEIQDETDEVYSSTQTRHWNSADRRDITTQDFMDNAESLMKKLMGSAPGDLDDTDAEEMTGMKEETSQFQTDSYESVDSEAEDYANSQRYQNYERTGYLKSNIMNTNEYQNNELPRPLDPEDPASSHPHNGRLGPPANVSAPKNPMRQNIKIIKQEDIKGIIPSIIGSMNYDEQNRKWHHQDEIHQHGRFDNSMNSRANITDEHDIFHGIDDLSDTRPGSPSIRSQHSSDPISHSHFTQPQATTNGNYENHNNIINKKFVINNIINQYEPGILGLENEEGLDFQQKLQSIKGCLIETPRSIQFPGTFDKEVSFALPPDHLSTERHDKPLISPVLLNNVAYSGIHPLPNDITHISQIDSSFSHSMSHLVEVFTTRYPNQMLWDKLTSINISKGTLESLARLNTICPFLKTLDASHNNISILQGIPFSVTRLDVSHNSLTNLSNFGGLDNIQYLNVAFNDIETFNCLSHLSHLRELIADGCPVTNLNGLSRIDGLLKLSVKGGLLEALDGAELKLALLQSLNLSSNKIKRVDRVEQLVSLRSLDLGKFHHPLFFFFFFF
jgi:hypothetical protein